MRQCLVLVSLWLAACGGGASGPTASGAHASTPPSGTAGGDCPARAQLAAAEDALGECRALRASDPGWPARGQYDTTLTRLSAHLSSLDPPRAVASEDVQPLAEEMWELLDQVEFPAGTEAARARAETAAERLLRERDVRAAPGAAIEALDSIAQVASVADPTGGVDRCAAENVHVGESRIAEATCESADQ